MQENGLDLNSLRVFARVVEKRSFSAGAKSLLISQSFASKCIRQLEEHLGVKLLVRSTRHISLTDAGHAYFTYCSRILQEVDEAAANARGTSATTSGHLRVFSTPGVGQNIVLPAVTSFMQRHGAISVELMLGNLRNLIEHHIDVAVRMTDENDSSLFHTSIEYRQIAEMKLVACAAPDYLRRAGTPAEPRDLMNHNCLMHSSKTTATAWRFVGPGGPFSIHPSGRFSSNNSALIHSAALDGLGVGLFLKPAVEADIRAGRLRNLFPEYCATRTLAAIFPRMDPLPRRTELFIEFLESYFVGHARPACPAS